MAYSSGLVPKSLPFETAVISEGWTMEMVNGAFNAGSSRQGTMALADGPDWTDVAAKYLE